MASPRAASLHAKREFPITQTHILRRISLLLAIAAERMNFRHVIRLPFRSVERRSIEFIGPYKLVAKVFRFHRHWFRVEKDVEKKCREEDETHPFNAY